MANKEPVRFVSDHLKTNTRRQYGPQKGKLVPCSTNASHGHHPNGEWCPDCLSYMEMVEEKARKKPRVDPLGVTGGYEYTVDDLRRAANLGGRRSAGQKLYEKTVHHNILAAYPWATRVPPAVQKTWEDRAQRYGITAD